MKFREAVIGSMVLVVATLCTATIIGNPKITFLNRQLRDPREFDSSTAVCKLGPPNDADSTAFSVGGTAFFVGGKLNMLITNMHTLTFSGKATDQAIRLKCGSKGHPADYSFDQVVQVKIEAQGRYNLSGKEDFGEEDIALLSIRGAESVFRDYKHFSFTVTETPDDIDSAKARTTGKSAIGAMRLQSFPGSRESIVTKNGTRLEFVPDELFRSDSCNLFKDEGGIWTHDCATLPGSSGSPIYIDRGSKPPMLLGVHTVGLAGNKRSDALSYEPFEGEGRRNRLIPLFEIQEIIQDKAIPGHNSLGNNALWRKLEAAEDEDLDDLH